MEAEGTARLTDRIPAERAVAASVSRREIRDVLQEGDGAPQLVIDVAAGDGSQEHGTISITWSREDLERLLESATNDEVVLTFDRNEVAVALGDDVEAHGLRARAAVFAVVAAGAVGSGASIANAMIPGVQDGAAGQSAALTTSTQDIAAAQAAFHARSQALNEEHGLAAGGVIDPAIQALQARGEAMNAQFGLGASGEAAAQAALQARSEAMNQAYNLDDPAVQALQARGEAMNAEFGLAGAPSDATVSDASTGGYVTPTATDGGGFTIQAPSTDDALLAGAAALMIAGAAFTVRKSWPRPA